MIELALFLYLLRSLILNGLVIGFVLVRSHTTGGLVCGVMIKELPWEAELLK